MLSKFKNATAKAVTAGTLFLTSASAAFAQANVDIGGIVSTGDDDLISFIKGLLQLIIGLAGLIAVAYLIWSGVNYIMANGDEGKIEKATKGITYSVIGLIICFISVLIVQYVVDVVLA